MIDLRHLTTVFLLCGLFIFPGIRHAGAQRVRQPVDSIGFATTGRQLDSVLSRIDREQGELLRKALKEAAVDPAVCWRTLISPHDDYAYAGYLYPAIMKT